MTSGKKLANMLPFSHPAGEERLPVTPNSAAAVASFLMNSSSEVVSLNAG